MARSDAAKPMESRAPVTLCISADGFHFPDRDPCPADAHPAGFGWPIVIDQMETFVPDVHGCFGIARALGGDIAVSNRVLAKRRSARVIKSKTSSAR